MIWFRWKQPEVYDTNDTGVYPEQIRYQRNQNERCWGKVGLITFIEFKICCTRLWSIQELRKLKTTSIIHLLPRFFLGSTNFAGSPTQLAASEVDQVLSLFGHLESNNIPELNNQLTVFRWSYILAYLIINIITLHLTGKQEDLQQVIMVHVSMVAGRTHMKFSMPSYAPRKQGCTAHGFCGTFFFFREHASKLCKSIITP